MKNKSGFTLIELLVVVLIIGILASIALPQYQKAVERSRATEAITILRSAGTAMQHYLLAEGNHPENFDVLTWDPPPWTGNEKWADYSSQYLPDTRSNGEWSLQLNTESYGFGVYIGRLRGKYKGTGFVTNTSGTKIYCAERVSKGLVFEGNPGDYCEKIMHGTAQSDTNVGTYRIYSLP